MTWTGVLIFWLVVAVTVLTVKNWWLTFTVKVLRDWQGKAILAIGRSLQGQPKREEQHDDEVLDSDVIN